MHGRTSVTVRFEFAKNMAMTSSAFQAFRTMPLFDLFDQVWFPGFVRGGVMSSNIKRLVASCSVMQGARGGWKLEGICETFACRAGWRCSTGIRPAPWLRSVGFFHVGDCRGVYVILCWVMLSVLFCLTAALRFSNDISRLEKDCDGMIGM